MSSGAHARTLLRDSYVEVYYYSTKELIEFSDVGQLSPPSKSHHDRPPLLVATLLSPSLPRLAIRPKVEGDLLGRSLKHSHGRRSLWRLGTPPFYSRQPRRAASRLRRPTERLSTIARPPLGFSIRRAGRLLYASARPSLPSGIAWDHRGGELFDRPPPTRCPPFSCDPMDPPDAEDDRDREGKISCTPSWSPAGYR